MSPQRFGLALLLVAVLCAGAAIADSPFGGSGDGGFTPQVPISAFSHPAAWLDPSRLHFSTTVSVGSGFGGTQALQVTSLSYQFKAPLWLGVSVGNAWGPNAAARGGSPFLEGLDIAYRPFSSMMVRVQYRDFRSPLQYSSEYAPGFWGR